MGTRTADAMPRSQRGAFATTSAAATKSLAMEPAPFAGWHHRLLGVARDKAVLNGMSGALAGTIAASVTTPLEVLKLRLQVQTQTKYSSILRGLVTIFREEGMRGLYRGLGPTLVAMPPNWAIYFTSYESARTWLGREGGSAMDAVSHVGVNAAAASFAGVVTCAATNPLWVVKTRIQVQELKETSLKNFQSTYRGTMHALRRIAHEEGVSGLYSGFAPSILLVTNVAIMLPLYEELKTSLAAHLQAQEGHRAGPGGGPPALSASEIAVCSSLAKCIASCVTYPQEVVRSRMQVSGRFGGVLKTAAEVYAEGGLTAFYRGCLTNLSRTIPSAAVTFTSFEVISRQLRALLDPASEG